MIKKMPDQEIFDEVFKICRQFTENVFDHRPATETAYPFVDIGATYTTHLPTKTAIKGTVTIDLNVWGLAQQRKAVSDIANQIFLSALALRETPNYFVSTSIQASTITTREDNTTNTRLWRGMLSLSINF